MEGFFACWAPDVGFPGGYRAIAAIEVAFVLWEMLEPKFLIGHGEVGGCEILVEDLVVDVSGAPTWVKEFPFAVVDSDCVPGVAVGFAWRDWIIRPESRVTYDEGLVFE